MSVPLHHSSGLDTVLTPHRKGSDESTAWHAKPSSPGQSQDFRFTKVVPEEKG